MAKLDPLGELPSFKPFYDVATTERLLGSYYQAPHLYNEDFATQIKDHAAYHEIPFEEEKVHKPQQTEFNLLRGIRQMGEGFFSGFTTFNVGEATNNPYERIMRSIGQVGGFVGYVPSAPGKILKSQALVTAAQNLRGNSVPLVIARKATELAAPIARETMEKAAKGRSGAVADVANFLIKDKSKHVAEGAFNLGIANMTGSWQLGVNEMLKQGLHGAVTGGAFRGIAELVNKGGIPKVDPLTGKSVLNATQKEDRVIRAAASSLYDGMQSTLRGETTPEQIYSYLLGAYFGANETTAGQAKVFEHIKNTEAQAKTDARALKRINQKTGKPYDWDTSVYNPEKVEGWDKLTDGEKDSVYQYMLSNHGTYGKQAMMTDRLIQETQLEPGDGITAEQAYKSDATLKELNQDVEQQQIIDKAEEISAKISFVDEITTDMVDSDSNGKLYLTERDAEKTGEKWEDTRILPLYTKGMTDENVTANKAIIKDAFNVLEKAVEAGHRPIAQKDLGVNLKEEAPVTYEYLQEKILKLEAPYEKAASLLAEQEAIADLVVKDNDDKDIGMVMSEVELDRKTNKFVNVHLKTVYNEISDPGQQSLKITQTRDELKGILKKHLKKYDISKDVNIDSDKFIGDVAKKFKIASFDKEGKQELRQLLIRQNQSQPIQMLSLKFSGKQNAKNQRTSRVHVAWDENPVIIGKEFEDPNKGTILSRSNQANEDKIVYDSIKAIDYAAAKLGIKDNVRMEMESFIIEKYNPDGGGRTNVSIKMKDIAKRSNFTGKARWKQELADANAVRIKSEALRHADSMGYYFSGGKGDSGKMIFLKWHPELGDNGAYNTTLDKTILKNDYIDGIIERGLKDPVTDKPYTKDQLLKHYNDMRDEFIADHQKTKSYDGTGSLDEAGIYFDKSFTSNLLWEKELYGVSDASLGNESFGKWIAKNSSIKDAKGFNKRNQIWMTDGYEVDKGFFSKTLANNIRNKKESMRTITDKLRYRLIEDSDLKNLTSLDEAIKFTEATDGMILMEENALDALNESMGLPESGQNKSFIVDNDPTYGAFLGKMMFHKASPEASKHMRESGIEMYVYDSAAKEKGGRQFGKLSVDKDLNVDWTPHNDANKSDYYEMNIGAIKGSLSEKQTQHMLEPQLLPKQMMANLVSHSRVGITRSTINDFFNETIGKHHVGEDDWNNQLKDALAKDPSELTDVEQERFIRNIDKLGLTQIVDALKDPNHTSFVAKLYKKILNKNIESLAYDYQSGEVSRGEYEMAHAEASNMNRGIDRMMDLAPTLEVFLYRDVRNYLQAAMKSFVVNKIIRPKWDYSMSVRMRGLDPWLAQKRENTKTGEGELAHLNLESNAANKKFLKDKYDVNNADELFFLDDRYRNTKWKVDKKFLNTNKEFTLEELWMEYGAPKNYPEPKMKEFFKTISLRVPMDSISGAHQLAFAGFTGIDGHGAVFHPRTMKALGGADLDGDKAFVFFGMEKRFRDMYHSNKHEFTPSGDESTTTRDNKDAEIDAAGVKVLRDTLADKEDDYSQSIIAALDKKGDKITFQDLLTTTTAGNDATRSIEASPLGKYTANARMKIGQKAVDGRGHLGPAVSSKQILNATYDAMIMSKDKSETIEYFDGDGEAVQITIKPRNNIDYARELQRAQIAFGSDPLDELGLVGIDNFFNLSWNSMFKVEFEPGTTPEQMADFTPDLAKKGLYKIFKDFNSAYFSKNWNQGRRWRATEIIDMAAQIKKLDDNQVNTMLPQMVKILEPIDYTDDISSRISSEHLKQTYTNYHKIIIPKLAALNKFKDKFGKEVVGGVLGRGALDETGKDLSWGKGFGSKMSPITTTMIDLGLYRPSKRLQYAENVNDFEKLMSNDDLKIAEGRFRHKFNSKEFAWRSNPQKAENRDAILNQIKEIPQVKGAKKLTKAQIAKISKLENIKEYNELVVNSLSYRKQVIDQLFRDGSEFMQFDAMDRASGVRLVYALEKAYEAGVSRDMVSLLSRQVQHIKEVERGMTQKDMIKEMETTEEFQSLNDAEKQEAVKILTMKDTMQGFSRQEMLSERIKEYKFFNKHKATLDPSPDSKYPGMLSPEESYLFDTMMMSSYYRGQKFEALDSYNRASKDVKEVTKPFIKSLKKANSGTFFRTLGLDSPFIKDNAIQDFLREYTGQLVEARKGEITDYNIEDIFKAPDRERVGITEVPKNLWEEDYVGLGRLREKSVAELNSAETTLVDELASHINHYRSSFKDDGTSLNKLARAVVSKNVDSMTTQDYRTLNNFFRQMRAGNMFVNPGKITKEGIVKLSQRHYMLFPKTVNDELMTKDFEIFEQKGFFQNFNGEWREGRVGRPSHIIEHIQYVNGTMQDLATKMNEDETNNFHKILSETTGYETLENGLGQPFFEVATALRDFKADKNATYPNQSSKHHAMKNSINNLRAAYEKAGWADIADDKKFRLTIASKRGAKGEQRGGEVSRTKYEIVESIDKVLTERTQDMMTWILGDHKVWDGKNYVLKSTGNPLDAVYQKDSSGDIMYHGTGNAVPKINMKKFANLVFEHMKEGKAMNLKFGIDNLRIVNRNLKIEQLYRESHKYKGEQKEAILELIKKMENTRVRSTNWFRPDEYHPHFIENKALAADTVKEQVDVINKKFRDGDISQEDFNDAQAMLVNRYKNLTGNWYIDDISDNDMFDSALNAVAEKRLKDPILEKLTGSPVTGNMMERNGHLAGWARDIGAWEAYQKNLIDAYFRQISQVTSQHMLQQFHDYTRAAWGDRQQADAWYDYVQDYISRSLGNPSRIPESWLTGDKKDLMNVKGTPYAWWADNVVVDKLNRIKEKIGLKGDQRLPEELRGLDEMDIRHWSNMEAKFQMATLLAHPKSAVANIFGGTLHTIQSVGWRNWRNSRNINWLKTNLGGSEAKYWKTMEDVRKWVVSHGVVPDFILHEANLSPYFKKGKWKAFLNDAKLVLDKDPRVKDETLRSLAKKHKITDAAFDKAAWFMREPEKMLRQDSFVAHYLAARERFGHANMELDHPLLIEMAKKGVKATQFLYSAPYRPAFSATSLGKAMTRFQTWAWNSVRFRNETYRQAAMYDFRRGTPEFERFKRQYITDMFVFGLGNVFAYSIFESAMPQPYSWFQDTADWLFGDEKERDRAFFGQWPTAVAPLQMVTPPGLRLVPATFNAIANNDFSRISEYQMWTMFPFGRLARDVKGIIKNPMRTVEKTTGIPYMQFADEATKYRMEYEDENNNTEELLDEK